ncbi:MAG: DUF6364 family protein [Verrucomicrobia bacterium]|nr:DUF6364 family protein [Verrucomicrobiota bacterium]
MTTAELKIQLPGDDVAFLEAYAEQHRMSLSTLMARYVTALRAAPRHAPHPANLQFTGTIPADVDVGEAYRQHLIEKHR